MIIFKICRGSINCENSELYNHRFIFPILFRTVLMPVITLLLFRCKKKINSHFSLSFFHFILVILPIFFKQLEEKSSKIFFTLLSFRLNNEDKKNGSYSLFDDNMFTEVNYNQKFNSRIKYKILVR